MSERRINICIFGASSARVDKAYADAAYEAGRLIGERGCGLIFGAGDSGLMGAAARGCDSAGGAIIGVIPEKLNKKGIYYERCTEKLVTPTMHERKATMERLADGFIALAGGFGTIEEFMEVLTLKQLNYFDKPIVLLNTMGYYDSLIAQLERCVNEGFAAEEFSALYTVCSTPQEAVDCCVEYKGMHIRDKMIDAMRGD